MTIQYTEITSLNEIDFDRVFEGSIDEIDRLRILPAYFNLEDKKNFYKAEIEKAISGEHSLQKDGEKIGRAHV